MKEFLTDLKNHVMTGVSYMIPAVTVGGICIAVALATGEAGDTGMVITSTFWNNVNTIGGIAIGYMCPMLAGYTAYSIAGRPGLLPGFALGSLANTAVGTSSVSTGFLGALVLGIAAGYLAKWVKGWKVPKVIKSIMPILIIPLVTTMTIGLLYIYIFANPLGGLVTAMTNGLSGLSSGSTVLLGIAVGCMIAFDMGGPVNKVAFATSVALIAEGNTSMMGMCGVAICVPPIGMGLATFICKKKFTEEEREAGKASAVMGCIGITEGAIPFAASDPIRVLPSIMTGSAVGAVIAGLCACTNAAPHGGLIVLPVVGNALMYTAAVLVGSLVVVGMIFILKKDVVEE
ncbi:PTS fructose transporter subunit IIC [Tannockella kyphosi]|uniref:PTS fructose transporter subunit IIC n=1 Tax=Tannockella kyphosi TaxID=2899121 RepID=UPI00201228E4|nr:PTS fructose transporter subunit IIC [Tannockella kyphosi]